MQLDPLVTHEDVSVNGINLRVHMGGPEGGRPVWLLHGFPECWYSWRNQINALSAAGYRFFAPEMRGYGRSQGPDAVEGYDLLTLVSDICLAMDHFGHTRAAVVGHDWGANVAWYLALQAPERVDALVTMSVPFAGLPKRPAIEIMRDIAGDKFNYIVYFQKPGVAEKELDSNIERTLRLLMFQKQKNLLQQDKLPAGPLFDDDMVVASSPAWCSDEDLLVYIDSFTQFGFRGPLNWYRNFERNFHRTAPLRSKKIIPPTLFLIGNKDPVKWLEAVAIERMPQWVPQLESHELAPCGHWIQNEQAVEVNRLLIDFFSRHYSL